MSRVTPWGMKVRKLPRKTLTWTTEDGHVLSITLEKPRAVSQMAATQLGLEMISKYVPREKRSTEYLEFDAGRKVEVSMLPPIDGELVEITCETCMIFASLTMAQPSDVEDPVTFEEFAGFYFAWPEVLDECLMALNELSAVGLGNLPAGVTPVSSEQPSQNTPPVTPKSSDEPIGS